MPFRTRSTSARASAFTGRRNSGAGMRRLTAHGRPPVCVMFHRTTVLLASLAVLFSCSRPWQTTKLECGASVDFPGEPRIEAKQQSLLFTVHSATYDIAGEKETLSMRCIVLPEIATASMLQNSIRDSFASIGKLTESKTTFRDLEARQFDVVMKDGTGRITTFEKDGIVYFLFVGAAEHEDMERHEFRKFIESFRFPENQSASRP